METPIKILIAEHDLHETELIRHELKKIGLNYIYETVQTGDSYCRALENFRPDIILYDFSFPHFDGRTALKIKQKITPETPMIITGMIGEENSIGLIKSGVMELVPKDKIYTLNTKFLQALRHVKEEKQKVLSEKSLKDREATPSTSQKPVKIGSWQTDLLDMTLAWSEGTFIIFDMDPGGTQPTYAASLDLIHPDDREMILTSFEKSITGDKINRAEHRIITPAGRVKYVEERWRILYDEHGTAMRAIGTCQDISERKNNEFRIHASEHRFRMLFEQNLAGFYQSTKEGIIINCNRAFATMLGYSGPEELVNTNADKLYFTTSDRRNFIENIIEKRKLRNHEGTLKRKDGSPLYFLENLTEHTDPVTGVAYFDGILIDITERKKTEREIGWLINNTEESFILVDNDLIITSFNDRARVLYSELFVGELEKGKNILDYHQFQSREDLAALYAEILMGSEKTEELKVPLTGGVVKYFSLKYKPARDDRHIIIGIFISAIEVTDKKNAELLKDFERRDKEALINSTTDLIWSVTTNFKLIAANKAFYRSLKNSANLDLVPGDDLLLEDKFPTHFISFWKTLYLRALGGKSFLEEIFTPASEGVQESWSETRFNPIYDGEIITGIACYSRDITSSRLIQNNLVLANKKLKTAKQIAKLGYWEKGENDILYWSDQIYQIWGVTREDFNLDFNKFHNTIHPDDIAAFDAAQNLALSGKGDLDIEHRIILPDNSIKWVHEKGETVFDDAGKLLRFEGTVQDITDRKNVDEALHSLLRDKNIILESIDDAFFAVDKNFIVTYWNNKAEKMLGKTVGDTVGRFFWDLFPESVGSTSFKNYSRALIKNEVIRFEDYYAPLEAWHEISAYPSANGLSVYFKDISARKRSESRMEELNRHLENNAKALAISNAELEQFAYVASHDLQEPLRMVTSFLGLLEKKYADKIDEKGRSYISFAVDGAKHMRRIILDILDYSKIGGNEHEPEAVALDELVEDIRILFRKEHQGKEPFIHSESLPVVQTFRTPLLQVFQNLVSNAIKYSREGVPPKIYIKVEEQEETWVFSVSDNGIGIEPDYFDKIFVIFQRLHNKDSFSGTGIGLSITKKIIENQGGKIWVKSIPAEGSTFYFTLPKSPVNTVERLLQP